MNGLEFTSAFSPGQICAAKQVLSAKPKLKQLHRKDVEQLKIKPLRLFGETLLKYITQNCGPRNQNDGKTD